MNKRSIALAAAALFATASASAASYFVVVPVPNHTAVAGKNVNVALTGYSLPGGLLGQAYAGFDFKTLLAVTGDASYTGYGVHWSVVAGSLPAGLTLNSDGTLNGTPTAAGTSSFQVMASYKSKAGQQAYQVVVGNLTVGLATGAPPQALVGQAYGYDLKQLLTVSGDSAYAGNGSGVTWSVVSSTLPAGLYLTSDGWIGGTPTAAGTGTITARATYKGINGQQTYQVVTLAINVSLAAATPPQGIVGQMYSFDLKPLLTVTGDSAYTSPTQATWSVVSGSLPAGLTLTSAGIISGTPTAAASGSVTVQAAYRGDNGQQTYQVVTLAINVALGAATPPQGIVGQTYTYDLKPLLAVTGDPAYTGPTQATWSITSGSLPAGLTLSPAGVISGTPTATGSGPVTVQAAYRSSSGQQTYQLVTLNIAVALASSALPLANVGTGFSYDFKPLVSVSGDSGYTASAVQFRTASGSSLPPGLSLSAAGVLSGTPTAVAAAQSFTVVADYRGIDGTQQYSITVNPAFFNFNPTIAATTTNYNLYSAARAAGWDGVAPLNATVTINSGVYVGGSTTGSYAFSTGSGFPAQTSLKLVNNGVIVGKGGDGGSWGYGGGNGGPAMLAQYPIKVTNNGTIAGGGGGGGGSNRATVSNVLAGGAGGGGGQGYGTSAGGAADPAYSGVQYPQGTAGYNGNISTPGLGGTGTQSGMFPNQYQAPWYAISGNGGNGGLLGQAGAASTAGQWVPNVGSLPGGAAGYAVVGAANVTWSTAGTVLGPQQ
jgi:hypothetical protein